MSEHADSRGSGWTVLKVIGLVLASLALSGFGLVGMCGLVLGIYDAAIFGWALAALLAAAASLAIVVWIIRSVSRGS